MRSVLTLVWVVSTRFARAYRPADAEVSRMLRSFSALVRYLQRRVGSFLSSQATRSPNPMRATAMSMKTFEKEVAHLGETKGAKDHDHDMIHDLSRRLDMLWRYDQYLANAEEHEQLAAFWRRVRSQERENIMHLKKLISDHVKKGCF